MASTSAKDTTTIRVRRSTLERLTELAGRDESMVTAMLDKVVDHYWREDLLRCTNEAYAIRCDQVHWISHRQLKRRLGSVSDQTLRDVEARLQTLLQIWGAS